MEEELEATLELANDDEDLLDELTTLDNTELELLLTGTVEFGFVPTKYRLGAAGVDIPSPRKKLVCGGWL